MSGAAASAPEAAPRAVPPDPQDPREAARSFRLGVANGALYQAGEGFIDSGTVIPVFLSGLTRSSALIGFATALGDFGWLLPQFLVTPWVSRQRRQLPLYRRAAVARAGALGMFALLVWPLHAHPAALLVAFFACYGTYCFGAGVAGLPFMEVVGRTVPHRRLGAYWAARLFWGGSLAALAGLVVRQVMRLEDAPLRYGLLFGIATVVVSVAYALFGSIREPDVPPGEPAPPPLEVLREGLTLLRHDAPFRNLLIARGALASWLTVSPFMVLLAVRDLRGGAGAAGTFLLSRGAGFVLANLVWPRLSRERGSAAVMRVATLGAAIVALAAAIVASFAPAAAGRAAPVIALEALAFFGGAAQSGMLVAYGSLVLELAPPGRRQMFVSLMSTFLGVTMVLPPLGGALVDRIGAPVVFAMCALVAAAGWRAARRLPALCGLEPESMEEIRARG